MLTINAPVFDIDGRVIIERPGIDGLTSFRRRVSRSATLDGGAAINDFGYSDADRTLNIEWTPTSRYQVEQVARMAKDYSRLIVSCVDGCFLAAPEEFSPSEETVEFTLLVERRLS